MNGFAALDIRPRRRYGEAKTAAAEAAAAKKNLPCFAPLFQVYTKFGTHPVSQRVKSDMDVERLPSGKFTTNELVLELTILAHNILRIIGQASLIGKHGPATKHPIKRRRLRTVINNLILIASHAVERGGDLILALGMSNIWRFAFLDIFYRFCPV